jgi:integrase
MRSATDIEERRWALKLALDFSRDNKDLKNRCKNYKYTAFFLPIKGFCDYHEAPLTASTGFFPKRNRRKYPDTPFTADFIRKVLAVLNERDRAICLCELQAGQAIKQILVDLNKQARYIFQQIDAGAQRIRLDFDERKGNGFPYFTYISADAIQAIQKWRPIRQQILNELGNKSNYLFITKDGAPVKCKAFHTQLRTKLINHGLYGGPLSCRSHGFRKFFEQEASPPERGISMGYITFMMGHSAPPPQDATHRLDIVGGTYDNAPRVYANVVEKEYIKLEPYLNIYTGLAAKGADLILTPEDEKDLKDIKDIMKAIREHRLELVCTKEEI